MNIYLFGAELQSYSEKQHTFGVTRDLVKGKADITNLTSLLCDLIALEYISKVAYCTFYVSLERSSPIWVGSLEKRDHTSSVFYGMTFLMKHKMYNMQPY